MIRQQIDEKSRNGDSLGLVELIVWPEQGNQGDWLEHDGQGEVSIIIFLLHMLVSRILGYHNLCSPGTWEILPDELSDQASAVHVAVGGHAVIKILSLSFPLSWMLVCAC